MNRNEVFSLRLHTVISLRLDKVTFEEWYPKIMENIDALSRNTQGEPHHRNINRWKSLFRQHDMEAIKGFMTGIDRDSIEMREVGPFLGIITTDERSQVVQSMRVTPE